MSVTPNGQVRHRFSRGGTSLGRATCRCLVPLAYSFSAVDLPKAQSLAWWLGHLARMPDDRLPKRVLFGHMDGTTARYRGRALKQWVVYVREDLQFAGLSLNWWRRSQDRAAWRAAIECLLQCT